MRAAVVAALCCMLLLPARLYAQQPAGTRGVDARAFGIEALGGITGSALGFGVVLALNGPGSCGENLSCTLGHAATAVLTGTVGSASLTYAAGRVFDTRPSGWGAIAGAVVGAAAAIGVDHLVSEEARLNMSDATRTLVFAATQGTLTALGSRLTASLR